MRKKEKIRFEVDPFNRLVYKKSEKKSRLPGFRTVIDGRFRIGKNNNLIYEVRKSPLSTIPQKIKLKGSWSLDKNHNLILTLNKWGNQIFGNKLILKGDLIDVKANKLTFAVTTKDSSGKTHLYTLNFEGIWQADKFNRLSFNIKKEKGNPDTLILKGSWEINKNNEIIYTYTKSRLKRKTKRTKTITFKGYWDITNKHRITYILNKEINSEFTFEVRLGKPAGRGMEYQIGIGVTPAKKKLTLSGQWKVNKRLGLIFEMPYEKGKRRGIIFGASCKIGKQNNLEFKLKNKKGDDLGIDIKLSRKIIKGAGETFLRALKEGGKLSIIAGVGIRW